MNSQLTCQQLTTKLFVGKWQSSLWFQCTKISRSEENCIAEREVGRVDILDGKMFYFLSACQPGQFCHIHWSEQHKNQVCLSGGCWGWGGDKEVCQLVTYFCVHNCISPSNDYVAVACNRAQFSLFPKGCTAGC